MTPLTKREHDCLCWAAQGKTSWEIGQILGIQERTVNFHIANTCEKLEVRTRQAAITVALQHCLLAPLRTNAAPAKNHPPAHGQNHEGLPPRSPRAIQYSSP